MTPLCFAEGRQGFEMGHKNDVPVSLDEVSRPLSIFDRTSSDPGASGIDQKQAEHAADDYLRRVKADLTRISRTQLLERGLRPEGIQILSPVPRNLQHKLASYAAGDDFFSCVLTFEAMRRASRDIIDEKRRLLVLWSIYQRYIDACHRGSLNMLGSARDRVVVLLRRNFGNTYSIYCLGFNYFKNFILTAHHCLVEPDSISLVKERYEAGDPDAYVYRDGPLPQTRALVLGEPNKLFDVHAPDLNKMPQDLNFYPFAQERDTVVLELADENRYAMIPPFPMDKPKEWDSIVVPALFVDDEALSTAINSSRAEVVNLAIEQGSALDVSPVCTLAFPTETPLPFLFHGCQTRYGYSGAPILRRDNGGGFTLVGVHTGNVDPARPVGGWPYAALFPNYGLLLPNLAFSR
jgi:hypothetical protein